MPGKRIVTISKLPVLPYAMDYLTYCRHCKIFGLGKRPCCACGERENIQLDEIAQKAVYMQLCKRTGIIIAGWVLIWLLRESGLQFFLCTLLMGVLAALNIVIYKEYKQEFINRELENFIDIHIDQIKVDLKNQMSAAIREVDADDLVAAYDRLRYLGKLMDNEEVRTFKLICVRQFELRSDMPLEMNTLLQKDYNTYLIDYIYEVSKVRKDLIDEETVLYIIEYKEQVLNKTKGKQIMASVLESCLRSRYMLEKYAKYMVGYVQYFSKNRLLRLCRFSSCISDDVLRKELLWEVKEAAGQDEKIRKYLE